MTGTECFRAALNILKSAEYYLFCPHIIFPFIFPFVLTVHLILVPNSAGHLSSQEVWE